MHKIENMPLERPIFFFFFIIYLCSYILIGNHVRFKSSGIAPGLVNARPPGSAKLADAPLPGLKRRANALQ